MLDFILLFIYPINIFIVGFQVAYSHYENHEFKWYEYVATFLFGIFVLIFTYMTTRDKEC